MKRVYRREAALTMAAVFVVPAVSLAIATMDPAEISERMILGTLTIIWATLAIRGFRLGVYFDSKEIVVRNVLRTHTVKWSDVRSIGMRPAVPFGVSTPGIELHDGGWIVLRGVEPPNPLFRPNNQDAERAVTLLRNELERRQAAA